MPGPPASDLPPDLDNLFTTMLRIGLLSWLVQTLLLFSLALLLLMLAGCGAGAGSPQAGLLTGTVDVDGSSTVFPLSQAVAEDFMRQHSAVRIPIEVSGTGGGFYHFVRGETDLSNASRPIRTEEVRLAREHGVRFVELPVAYDGLAVLVHPANDWASCLTVAELRRIWEPGSAVTSWRQVRPGFPDRPLALFGPGSNSGTYDYFTLAISGAEDAIRMDYTASESDDELVEGIAADPNALGFFGLSYYAQNRDRLRLVALDDGRPENGEGCVRPTPETVQSGRYQPLSRPVFIYVNEARLDDPAVSAFASFYLEHAARLAAELGLVPLPEETYALVRERLARRLTGSVFGGGGAQVGLHMEELLRLEQRGIDTTTVEAASPLTP